MRDRDERSFPADFLEAPRRSAVQLQLGRAAVAHDFHVAPQHAVRMTGAERFHRRFLGGETAGEMDCRKVAPRAVRDLSGRENAGQKTVAVSLDRCGDALDVGGIEAEADDV